MISHRFMLPILAAILLNLISSVVANDRAGADKILDGLNWLAGSWEGNFEGHRFEAYYTTPEGGAILSISKEFPDNRSCFIEFEKFSVLDDDVILIPYPNGKPSVTFTLTDYNPEVKVARFENTDHDFPTDITYQQTSDDSLSIHVAGPQNGRRVIFTIELSRKN